jgi:hypothetical protein
MCWQHGDHTCSQHATSKWHVSSVAPSSLNSGTCAGRPGPLRVPRVCSTFTAPHCHSDTQLQQHSTKLTTKKKRSGQCHCCCWASNTGPVLAIQGQQYRPYKGMLAVFPSGGPASPLLPSWLPPLASCLLGSCPLSCHTRRHATSIRKGSLLLAPHLSFACQEQRKTSGLVRQLMAAVRLQR